MKIAYWHSLSLIRTSMVILNLFNILFYASVILLTTKYIVDNNLSREFLSSVDYLPREPLLVFFGSLILYGILVYLIYNRGRNIRMNQALNSSYSFLELGICFMIIYLLYLDYDGLILLVFCNCLYYIKDDKYSRWLLVALVIVYLLANWDVFSAFTPMTNLELYFKVYNAQTKGILMVIKSVLRIINTLLFISFIIVFITAQLQENANISKKLSRILTVNRELKDYAAVTEKIGESNERKRLAREIHDTLGHALAGIAAGVDACIVIIDANPQAAKAQLKVISKVVRQGMSDVRNSLNKLRPGALEQHGLKGALEKMIEDFSSISKVVIKLDYRLENVDLATMKENTLFRIIQESITNAMRHGGASLIEISVYQEAQKLCLRIKDNGVGCDEIHYGFGLKQMKERISIINGTVEFDGSNGFLTVVRIPMERGEYCD